MQTEGSDQLFSTAATLGLIRRWLSLSITELSQVARVERPTIYAWMQGHSAPSPASQHRLRELHQLASAWRAQAGGPFEKSVREPQAAKTLLLDLLMLPTVDVAKVLELFATLAPSSRPARSTLSRIVSEAGLEPNFHDEADRSFDTETRLR